MISRLSHRICAGLGMVLFMTLAGMSLQAAQSDSQNLVEQGQHAFATGAFSQAADNWHKALELFRAQGNTNAEIRTSLSLAGAYQSLGQYQPAVQLLDKTLARTEATQD